MIWVTGDTHGEFSRLSGGNFRDGKQATKDDYVIILGDFGLWHDCPSERYRLDWLNDRPFTTLFVDGNHENFDRLYSDEFEEMPFCQGKVHKIRDSVLHLQRGHVFTMQNHSFFVMGGASSHDVSGGIYQRGELTPHKKKRLQMEGLPWRVEHESWWPQEMPSEEELRFGEQTLKAHNMKVDFVLSHCLPVSVQSLFGYTDPDALNFWFETMLAEGLTFRSWFAGHYHMERDCWVRSWFAGQRGCWDGEKAYVLLYNSVRPIVGGYDEEDWKSIFNMA